MIKELASPKEKALIADTILRTLPQWFGIEESLQEYMKDSQTMPFWAAYSQGSEVGFAALKIHNPHTAEIYVMGVLPDYHRQSIGQKLIVQCESYCKSKGFRFLTVKTLAPLREDASYAKTRRFYEAMGFLPLEVFPTLWGKENPCLFLAKVL